MSSALGPADESRLALQHQYQSILAARAAEAQRQAEIESERRAAAQAKRGQRSIKRTVEIDKEAQKEAEAKATFELYGKAKAEAAVKGVDINKASFKIDRTDQGSEITLRSVKGTPSKKTVEAAENQAATETSFELYRKAKSEAAAKGLDISGGSFRNEKTPTGDIVVKMTSSNVQQSHGQQPQEPIRKPGVNYHFNVELKEQFGEENKNVYFVPDPGAPHDVLSLPKAGGSRERVGPTGIKERYTYDPKSDTVSIEYPDEPGARSQKVEGGFFEGAGAVISNLAEPVRAGIDSAFSGKPYAPRYQPELESGAYEAVGHGQQYLTVKGIPVGGSVLFTGQSFKNLSELGSQAGQNPAYFAGSVLGSGAIWVATLGTKPAIEAGRSVVGGITARRTEAALKPFMEAGAKLEEPIIITIEKSPIAGTRFVNIGTESSVSKFGTGIIKPSGKVGLFERQVVQKLKPKEILVPSKQLTAYTQSVVDLEKGTFPVRALKSTKGGEIEIKEGQIFEQTQVIEGKEPVYLKVGQRAEVEAIKQEFTIPQLKALGSTKEGINKFFGRSDVGIRKTIGERSTRPGKPFKFEPQPAAKQTTKETVTKLISTKPVAKSPIEIISKPVSIVATTNRLGLGGGGYRSSKRLGFGGATGAERKQTSENDVENVFLPTPPGTKGITKGATKQSLNIDVLTGSKQAQRNIPKVDQKPKTDLLVGHGFKLGFGLSTRTDQASRTQSDLVPRLSVAQSTITRTAQRNASRTIARQVTRTRVPPVPGFPLPEESKRRSKGKKFDIFGGTKTKGLGTVNVLARGYTIFPAGIKKKGSKKRMKGFAF